MEVRFSVSGANSFFLFLKVPTSIKFLFHASVLRMMVNTGRRNAEIMGCFRIKGQIRESSWEESALLLFNVDETYANVKNLCEIKPDRKNQQLMLVWDQVPGAKLHLHQVEERHRSDWTSAPEAEAAERF